MSEAALVLGPVNCFFSIPSDFRQSSMNISKGD